MFILYPSSLVGVGCWVQVLVLGAAGAGAGPLCPVCRLDSALRVLCMCGL
jgi:hypothetical protein